MNISLSFSHERLDIVCSSGASEDNCWEWHLHLACSNIMDAARAPACRFGFLSTPNRFLDHYNLFFRNGVLQAGNTGHNLQSQGDLFLQNWLRSGCCFQVKVWSSQYFSVSGFETFHQLCWRQDCRAKVSLQSLISFNSCTLWSRESN